MDIGDARKHMGAEAASTGGEGSARLNEIREGMTVIDAAGEEIGTVDYIKMGDPQAATTDGQTPRQRGDELLDVAAGVFGAESEPKVPEAMRARFLRSGFFKIDSAGLFAKDRYVTADQIADVSAETVRLSVAQGDLAERN
ncbi:MAG: DUF2171 domain-containing protein [Chloroflexota bacterium]|nr:DUF2171 domain-containing protein [Chloroflexota bacterium]